MKLTELKLAAGIRLNLATLAETGWAPGFKKEGGQYHAFSAAEWQELERSEPEAHWCLMMGLLLEHSMQSDWGASVERAGLREMSWQFPEDGPGPLLGLRYLPSREGPEIVIWVS